MRIKRVKADISPWIWHPSTVARRTIRAVFCNSADGQSEQFLMSEDKNSSRSLPDE
jgi:hypothetical protein